MRLFCSNFYSAPTFFLRFLLNMTSVQKVYSALQEKSKFRLTAKIRKNRKWIFQTIILPALRSSSSMHCNARRYLRYGTYIFCWKCKMVNIMMEFISGAIMLFLSYIIFFKAKNLRMCQIISAIIFIKIKINPGLLAGFISLQYFFM